MRTHIFNALQEQCSNSGMQTETTDEAELHDEGWRSLTFENHDLDSNQNSGFLIFSTTNIQHTTAKKKCSTMISFLLARPGEMGFLIKLIANSVNLNFCSHTQKLHSFHKMYV